ncbi:MAG: glycosyltransferase [Desulfobaccales bacterium]
MKKVGISMPVANEELTISNFLEDLLNEISKLNYSFFVYVVMDNFSKDGTWDIVQQVADQDPRVKLVFFKESTGVVSCYLKGFKEALADHCDFIIEMDSGGSHPPERIGEILESLDGQGFDVAFMSRFMSGAGIENFPFYRRVVSQGGTILANLWLGTKYSDATSGYEGFRQEVLNSLNLDAFISTGGIYQTEMKYYCYAGKFKIKEIPFVYIGTTTAFKSKWIWIALKTLYRIKYNTMNVLRRNL